MVRNNPYSLTQLSILKNLYYLIKFVVDINGEINAVLMKIKAKIDKNSWFL